MLKLSYYPQELTFLDVFAVSSNSRKSTQVVMVEIAYQDKIGYGEASFPPYLGEKRDDNLAFLEKIDLSNFATPFALNEILQYLDQLSPRNFPAKAAIDMALHDLIGKVAGLPIFKILGLETAKKIYTSYTIGIGDDDFIQRQIEKAQGFKTIKVKLNADAKYNKHAISLIKKSSAEKIGVDFNQAFTDKKSALEMLEWLHENGIAYAEQPLSASQEDDCLWLKKHSPLDLYGDESIQNAVDILARKDFFHGVNIKLMKCGGIRKAFEMAVIARNLGLKVMIGCMVESSCAISAAAQLASLCDNVDLDGNLLIANDPFQGILTKDGALILSDKAGLGIEKI